MGQLSVKQRLAFLLFNILYFGIGAGMLAVGIYNIFVLQGFSVFSRPYYLTGGALFILVGVVKVVLSLLGILGMFLQQRILITIYVILFGLVMLPTLAAGVFGLQQWFYVYGEVGSNMKSVFSSSASFNETATLRQTFRDTYNCCGIENGASDYNATLHEVIPLADCDRARVFRENTAEAPAIGCQYYITDGIRYHLYYIGGIGLGFGFFEFLSLIVAMQNLEGVV